MRASPIFCRCDDGTGGILSKKFKKIKNILRNLQLGLAIL
jgi:hypothetical protein